MVIPIPSRLLSVALFLALLPSLLAQGAPSRPWSEDVIYFALTDRFLDGDAANNVPAGSDPALYDKSQAGLGLYQGGDFRGLERAIASGYFEALGVTAIWITPPVRNVWCSPFDADGKPKTGYHGYWTQDFLDIDPHLVSRQSLDGSREYPDTRDGRMQHYRDFVALAHRHGIKIIQDIVCNHAGPVFFYDADGDGQPDLSKSEEWVPPFKTGGYYTDASWADIPKWGIRRTEPASPQTVLGREVPIGGSLGDLASYGRKGMSDGSLGATNGEEVQCDFFSLRDFWTAPDSAHFDRLVDDFVEIYAFYAETIGVDGFRIDTVKHVDHAFWDAFTERLRKRLGPARAKDLLLFGEVYDGNAAKVGAYTYRLDWPQDRAPSLDSLLNFPFCFAVRGYLRTGGPGYGKAGGIEDAFRSLRPEPPSGATRPDYNPTPGSDGLNAAQKIVNFVENHDGLNRFRVHGIGERRNLLANALVLAAPGIPCLYYGTEAALEDRDGRTDRDSETGRLTFLPAAQPGRLDAVRGSDSFKATAALIALRQKHPVLVSGAVSPLWVDNDSSPADDGVFAFARDGAGHDPVIVVLNASGEPRTAGIPGQPLRLVSAAGQPLLGKGDRLEPVPVEGFPAPAAAAVEVAWEDGFPHATLPVAAESMSLYRRVTPAP